MPEEIDFEYAGVTKLLFTFDKVQLARLLEVLVVDLDKQPHVYEEELEPLPESLSLTLCTAANTNKSAGRLLKNRASARRAFAEI
jgi:hypothetical protein